MSDTLTIALMALAADRHEELQRQAAVARSLRVLRAERRSTPRPAPLGPGSARLLVGRRA
jgi:hypothetical protein